MNVPFVAQIDNCQRRTAWAHRILAAAPTSSAERGGMGGGGRRNSHVTAFQEDYFSTDESKVPVLHI